MTPISDWRLPIADWQGNQVANWQSEIGNRQF